MNNPRLKLVEVAKRFLGVEESPRGSNCGPMVNTFKAATTLPSGESWPWCAAFVSYVVQHADAESEDLSFPHPPRLAAAFSFESWGRENGAVVFSPSNETYKPEPGDIVTYTFSHIGIIESVSGGSFVAIEGNTNDDGSREGYEVARRTRTREAVRQFIRLPAVARKA